MSDIISPNEARSEETGIAMIGFGEAGRAILRGWGLRTAARVKIFDLCAPHDEIENAATVLGAETCAERAEALGCSAHAVCLVTADQAVAAARECSLFMKPGTIWYDGNSCSPDAKRRAAEIIQGAGGHYVDMAIMAPVHPRLHRTPLLIAGPKEALSFLEERGMDYRYVGQRTGAASSVKMIRSVMIKGMEALTAECLMAAHQAGVVDDVLASLQASDAKTDWRARSNYNLERMMTHGLRRASEMREVVATIEALGLPARMAMATADWQDQIGELALRHREVSLEDRLSLLEPARCSPAISAT